jgi:hypothetical protein
VLALITQIRDQLPLRSLKASERRALSGMGDQNRVFVKKVLAVLEQNSDFLPRSFDVDKMRQNMETFERLDSILTALNQLRNLVDSTAIGIGSEAYNQARIAYRYARASEQGATLEAIVGDFGKRYAKKSKKVTASPENSIA